MILQKEIALVSRVCIYIITRKDVINSCVSKFLEFRYRSGENGATVLYCTMYHVMCTMYQFYFNKFWLRCRLNLLFNDNSLIFLKNVQIFKVFFFDTLSVGDLSYKILSELPTSPGTPLALCGFKWVDGLVVLLDKSTLTQWR